MMIRTALLHEGKVTLGAQELIDRWSPEGKDRLWVDIVKPTQEEIEPILEDRFGFHALAAEDAVSAHTLPKYDAYPDYDFFIFRAVNVNLNEHGIDTTKLAVFLSDRFIFTVHDGLEQTVDTVRDRLPNDARLMVEGTDFLLYSIIDLLVDMHFPIIDEIEDRVDAIQDRMFTRPRQDLLDEVLHFKRDLNQLRRHSVPQRELLNAISRGDAKFVKRDHLIYFRDLYDHMYRISEWIDVERDLTTSTLDAYLSVVANRTNDIMKLLTIISTVLLPINMLAGIYGMNFAHIPFLRSPWGFWAAIGVMLAIAVGMLGYFTHKGWLFEKASDESLIGRLFMRRRHPLRKLRHRRRRLGPPPPPVWTR